MSSDFKFDWVIIDTKAPPPAPEAKPQTRAGLRPLDPGNPFGGGQLVSGRQPPTRIETMTLAEAREEGRSAHGKAMLINMPLCLVEPAARTEVRAGHDEPAWGLADTGAIASGWTGKGVTVAILDTGIEETHEAFRHLRDRIEGQNFVNETQSQDFADLDGHGTHCAGTIFGGAVGGRQIGVAPGVARVLVAKVLDGRSGGDAQTLATALHWAVYKGADVISMSIGMDFAKYLEILRKKGIQERQAAAIALGAYRLNLDLFKKLSASLVGVPGLVDGAVVIGAAGNESDHPNYSVPACLPCSDLGISVAALRINAKGRHEIAPFSNVRATIGAPGVSIVSARLGGGLVSMDGTSMAAPHVAGATCLWTEALESRRGDGRVSAADVISAIERSAAPIEPEVPGDLVNWGRVQAPPPPAPPS